MWQHDTKQQEELQGERQMVTHQPVRRVEVSPCRSIQLCSAKESVLWFCSTSRLLLLPLSRTSTTSEAASLMATADNIVAFIVSDSERSWSVMLGKENACDCNTSQAVCSLSRYACYHSFSAAFSDHYWGRWGKQCSGAHRSQALFCPGLSDLGLQTAPKCTPLCHWMSSWHHQMWWSGDLQTPQLELHKNINIKQWPEKAHHISCGWCFTHLSWATGSSCSHWRACVWSSSCSCPTTGSSSRSWGHRRPSGTVRESEEASCTEVSPSRVLCPGCCLLSSLLSRPELQCCHNNTAVLLRTEDCWHISKLSVSHNCELWPKNVTAFKKKKHAISSVCGC